MADFDGVLRKLVILDRRGRVPEDYIAAANARGFDVLIETDLEAAIDKLGAVDVMEVLIEAGPEVTTAVLDAWLWDEHVVITQGAEGAADDVTIRQNPNTEWKRSA